jgi:ribosomal protein S18 acetylase RimI-like enzyme
MAEGAEVRDAEPRNAVLDMHIRYACCMSGDAAFIVRRATEADAGDLGRLGGLLLRAHYAFDSERFIAPGSDPESGYEWFLRGQLNDGDAVVLVAEQSGAVIGYVFAALEPISWKELRDACGFIHDLVVDEAGRRGGVATALMEAAMQWLRSRGAPRVVLGTAERNAAAQRLFEKLGFRRTMIEMTREL